MRIFLKLLAISMLCGGVSSDQFFYGEKGESATFLSSQGKIDIHEVLLSVCPCQQHNSSSSSSSEHREKKRSNFKKIWRHYNGKKIA